MRHSQWISRNFRKNYKIFSYKLKNIILYIRENAIFYVIYCSNWQFYLTINKHTQDFFEAYIYTIKFHDLSEEGWMIRGEWWGVNDEGSVIRVSKRVELRWVSDEGWVMSGELWGVSDEGWIVRGEWWGMREEWYADERWAMWWCCGELRIRDWIRDWRQGKEVRIDPSPTNQMWQDFLIDL